MQIRVKEISEKEDELKETSPFFESSMVVGTVKNQYAREFGTTIYLFKGAKIDIIKRIKNEIGMNKK